MPDVAVLSGMPGYGSCCVGAAPVGLSGFSADGDVEGDVSERIGEIIGGVNSLLCNLGIGRNCPGQTPPGGGTPPPGQSTSQRSALTTPLLIGGAVLAAALVIAKV